MNESQRAASYYALINVLEDELSRTNIDRVMKVDGGYMLSVSAFIDNDTVEMIIEDEGWEEE